jgi:hypothetical protein
VPIGSLKFNKKEKGYSIGLVRDTSMDFGSPLDELSAIKD